MPKIFTICFITNIQFEDVGFSSDSDRLDGENSVVYPSLDELES